jgi:hypothetical protein
VPGVARDLVRRLFGPALPLARRSVSQPVSQFYLPNLPDSSSIEESNYSPNQPPDQPTTDASVRLHAHDVTRPLWDKCVWSSLVYGLAGVYSLWLGQYALGTLQLVTCGGSTLYHLRKEAVYFNLDNIFASSLLFLTLYAGGLAIHVEDWAHCLATALGLPVAVFLIVWCGMPATLARDPCTGQGTRQCAGPHYDDWHSAWHFASGLGTVAIAHLFQRHWPQLQCGGPNFALFRDLPIVPTLCVVLALFMNIAGNWGRIMPVL